MKHPILPPSDDTEDDLLAAEYVLGVLPLAARRAVETRMTRDPAFAAAISAWENRMDGLNETYAPIKAPNLLPAIEARLFGIPAPKPIFWRGWLSGAVSAAVLALLVLAFVPLSPPALFTPLTTLTADAQDLRYEVRHEGAALRITRTAGLAAERGRVHELWLIAGQAAPVSLGLIDAVEVDLTVPGLEPGMVLAVSLEPAGGSTTGAPTGPVLVTGVIPAG